ncbi:MAG: DNA-processing protein DprA [Clostridiales bacterium]|nr:DNA-processing protein DprA [Clostridiales bacterium]
MTERESTYMIARMDHLGPVAYNQLMAWYGTAEQAWKEENPPLTGKKLEEWVFFHRKEKQEELRRELDQLPAQGIRFLSRNDDDYPEAFRSLYDAPIGLFLRGKLPAPEEERVAMVGARKCSEYGKNCALYFGRELARENIWVVSGMALGIDAWGQWGALREGGKSLAILGSGIDVCYPSSHQRLYRTLWEQGGILSEYGPGVQGLPFHFPKRNRLISAISRLVLVIEARPRSGSLITVDQALEQGKDVLAVPGRIDEELSMGCNHLIRQGAGILGNMDDIRSALGRMTSEENGKEKGQKTKRKEKGMPGISEKGEILLSYLSSAPIHMDRLLEETGWSIPDLLTVLLELEEKGLVRQIMGSSYVKTISFHGR